MNGLKKWQNRTFVGNFRILVLTVLGEVSPNDFGHGINQADALGKLHTHSTDISLTPRKSYRVSENM